MPFFRTPLVAFGSASLRGRSCLLCVSFAREGAPAGRSSFFSSAAECFAKKMARDADGRVSRLLISPAEFCRVADENRGRRRMLVVDCSYTDLPVFGGRDATQEFLEGPRLQGALRFDVDVCCAPSCALPHMEPSPGFVDEYVRRLLRRQEEADGGDLRGEAGSEDLSALKRSVLVVAYDSVGFFSAPRVWWLLSRAGWEVRVLNGGLKAAVACGAELDWTPLSSDCLVSMPERDAFASAQGLASNRRRREGLATYEEVLLAVCQAQRSGAKACEESLPFVLVDARPAARFLGQEPEPREGLFSGRIPCAMNLPFARVWSERCVWGGTEKDAAAALLPQQSLPPSSSLSVFDSAAPLHPPFAWAELKEQRELKEALGPVLRRARVLGASLQQLQSDEGATAPLDFSNAKPVVATCGSGLTACVLYCALLEVGFPSALLKVFDGSWTEWVQRRQTSRLQNASEPWLVTPLPTEEAVREFVRSLQGGDAQPTPQAKREVSPGAAQKSHLR